MGLIAGMTACSSPASKRPAASPTSNPSAGTTPAEAAAQLFGVLEARRCKAPEPATCENPGQPAHDTAAIAGLDGFAVAKTTFTPRGIPVIGNAAAVLDLEGQAAAGGLYFIDGTGVVRRLDPDLIEQQEIANCWAMLRNRLQMMGRLAADAHPGGRDRWPRGGRAIHHVLRSS